MPQNLRAQIPFKNFSFPVSYRTNVQGKMRDARNVYTNQDRLDTRNGFQHFNSVQIGSSGSVLSISFFKKTDGTRHYLAKVGTTLYKVSELGSHTAIKTGLSPLTKHRSVVFNDRAIIAIESDGLFAYDGTTFSALGETPPTAPTVAKSVTGATLSASVYQVAITYYASSLGFETNIGIASTNITIAAGEQIDVTAIPTSNTNDFIDKKRVYIKDVNANSDWIFWDEINLATTVETIDDNPASTLNPPTKNAAPLAGGGKFLTVFGKQIVYSGSSSFSSDVFFSEPYLPDAFDDSSSTRLVLKVSGQGPITGIATGFYNDSGLSPYLLMFKKGNVEMYSEAGGVAQVSVVSSSVGCISHDTIREVDGDVYFMSENGWHVIQNGQLLKKQDKAFKLGDGDIDNIFNENGYVYEVNKSNFDSFFSVYYPTLSQYMTFVSEGSNSSILKAYNYEFSIGGFRPYEFKVGFTCAALAESSSDEEVLLIGGPDGQLYKHSIDVTRHDQDEAGASVAIEAFAQLYWITHDDLDATMNFGTMAFQALSSDEEITVKCFLNYLLDSPTDKPYNFSSESTGFILDVSKLDEGVLGDGRTIVRSLGTGIYRTAKSLLIGFYQTAIDKNLGLINGQIDASKNGNSNA